MGPAAAEAAAQLPAVPQVDGRALGRDLRARAPLARLAQLHLGLGGAVLGRAESGGEQRDELPQPAALNLG